MTTAHRDHRGRFVSADEHAATRLLEAAVREAVATFRTGPCEVCAIPWLLRRGSSAHECTDRHAVTSMLTVAGNGAALLLGEAVRL